MPETIELARLPDAARERYLRYAMSVITSRALPDVRDGLKPVQRRILYAMQADLALGGGDAKHKKSAEVVGAVMGTYHPHGDQAIYEAMARMAQAFSLRYPLVDGQGNFGAISGDPPAHMRYTECRLRAISTEYTALLGEETVGFRPNYSQTTTEPIVLPATAPFLLVNGTTGIAVGMATNIPAHNLREVVGAAVQLIENPEATTAQLVRALKGPDFPTGGEVLTTRDELRTIYETGRGSFKLRGTYEVEEGARGSRSLVITSVPYGTTVDALVAALNEIVREKRVPHAVDVHDDSDKETAETGLRVVVELRRDSDPQELAAYLYKHTPLQVNYGVNMTCLVPTENPLVGRPEVLDLKGMLRRFLDFRFEVVTKSLQFRLGKLEERIHILEGFLLVLKGLDLAIKLIRGAKDREDAQKKLMKSFKLDAAQADAVLELRLWKLSQLEIEKLKDELKEKRETAATIEKQLKGPKPRWKLIRDELLAFGEKHGDARRTRILLSGDVELAYDAEAYIAKEDTNVVVTKIGLVKRVRSLKDPTATRVREDDRVGWILQGSTRSECVFFSSFGSAYTAKLVDAPATTGYGDPVQKLFKFGDGERIVSALSLDPRVTPEKAPKPPAPAAEKKGGKARKAKKAKAKEPEAEAPAAPPPYLLVVTAQGHVLRAPLAPLREVSTRSGRRFARTGEGDEVVACELVPFDAKDVIVATLKGYAHRFPLSEAPVLAGVGKGPRALKLEKGDKVVAATVRAEMLLETTRGTEEKLAQKDLELGARGETGTIVKQRGGFVREIPPAPELRELEPEKGQ